jgi:outer membrane protein assembly factor BamA
MAPAFAAGARERRFVYAELRHRDFDGGLVFDDEGGAIPYRLEDTSIDLVGGQRLGVHWLLGLRAGVVSGAARVDTSSSESSGDGRMGAWLSASARERDGYFRTAASLAFDDRDHPRRPTQGSYLELSFAHFGGMQQHPSFDRLTLDARRFQALGSPERVLALRASATLDGGTGAEVPFYLLDTLGGDRLRGYDPYRFRGPSVIAFSAEYRQALARSLEAVAFWDVGRAWGGAPAMGTDGLRGSYGLGVRLLSPSGVLLRLEGARGAEGVRFQARLGFAF